tara:strand:+ start:527 stop:772 length:246 start_codon:yes stop_codon:yes gene_type:complete
MMQLREDIVKALKQKLEGEISAHKVNVEIMLENTVGVGEHPNIIETVEKELEIIAGNEDKLSVLKKYFTDQSYKEKEVLNG